VERANAALWLAPNPLGLEFVMASNRWTRAGALNGTASRMFCVTMSSSSDVQCSARSANNRLSSAFWPWLTTETVTLGRIIVRVK
jgi:hypothetical protein